MKNVFQVRVELRERGTSYPMREVVFVLARDVAKATERADQHVRATYKRRSVPLSAVRTVAVELIGEAIT